MLNSSHTFLSVTLIIQAKAVLRQPGNHRIKLHPLLHTHTRTRTHTHTLSCILKVCAHMQKSGHYVEVMDMLICLIVTIFTQCIRVAKHQIVHRKYIQFLFVNDISRKLFFKKCVCVAGG